jgi:2-polyprenyl-6-hydroxyphenyl methylase/3-demethylubiquinone-9 3-methyltransferase
MSVLDHSSHEKFFDYYANASQSEETRQRFRSIRAMMLRILKAENAAQVLDVGDVGCGAGTQSMLWAELGHRVHGLDINEPLVTLARQRAAEAGLTIDFRVGSATALPWLNASIDVCLVPELLEHVAEWQACLSEFSRILRPGGVLFLTTTNKLCPMQQEFDLPLYSWYPGPLKRYVEHLAVTTRPGLVNYAKYPAVNWFSFYGLRRCLAGHGFYSMDRFDVMDLTAKGKTARLLVGAVRANPICRFLAHVVTPSTILVAVKGGIRR